MSNYELTDAGLVTSDPVIASMFLEAAILYEASIEKLVGVANDCWLWWDGTYNEWESADYPITIPYSLVREAYQPVEGEGFVYDHPDKADNDPLTVHDAIPGWTDLCYHKRVLNIVTTRAELRELVAKCEEAV